MSQQQPPAATVIVLKNLLSPEALEAFRIECSEHYASTISKRGDDEQERSCSIDLFETAQIDERHPCRRHVAEYLDMRWREKRPSLQRCKSIEDFFFRRTPEVLRGVLGVKYQSMYLFNENYIVKSPGSELQFSWHTDEREQFKCQFMMREAEADDEDDSVAAATILFPEYVSVWCALDDCSASNGALAFATNTRVLELDCSSNTLFSGNKRKHGHHHLFDGLPSFIPDTKIRADTSNWGLGSPMVIPAGTAVLFSSRTWHCSGANTSESPRRVLYAQYSPTTILAWDSTDEESATPLSFAVDCSLDC